MTPWSLGLPVGPRTIFSTSAFKLLADYSEPVAPHTHNTTMTQILIDADMLLYAVCTASETEVAIAEDQWTRWVDLRMARDKMTELLLDVYTYCGEEHDAVLCFSSGRSWRREIYPRYKESRRTRKKPIGFKKLMGEYLETFGMVESGLEADDLIGICASRYPDSWIVSGDKDLDQIPGRHYWPGENGQRERGRYWEVTEEEARRKFWIQTLMGDSTDDIPGCPGIGAKRAEAALAECTTDLEYWKKTVRTYEKACVDKELAMNNAITTANLVRIMRSTDYDFSVGTPIPWTPPVE